MNKLRWNILANFTGQGWLIILNLMVIPFYVKLLGAEGYGLIGFYLILQAVFNAFLDFGLSITVNREIARYSTSPEKVNYTRDLVRTLETGYWLIGVLIGFAIMLSASFLSSHWIVSENIPVSQIRQVVVAMGIATIFQWPLTFYQGGMVGIQKMVLLNGANIGFLTLRYAGAVLVLWFVASTPLLFFQWQIFTLILQVFFLAFMLKRNLPASDHFPRFDVRLLSDVWRFALGMSATTFLGFFLSQADRLILSRFLTLEFFGYYTLAATLNNGLRGLSAQLFTAIFPRFSELIARNDVPALRFFYHRSSQMAAIFLVPIAVCGAFFSNELIYLWTQNAMITQFTAPVAKLLFIGTAFNMLVGLPYDLTVAYGWTTFGIIQNIVSAILIVPLMIILADRYGGMGVAFTWILLNCAYFLILPAVMHIRLLKGELWSWYVRDTLPPVLASVVVAGLGYSLVDSVNLGWSSALMIGLVTVIAVLAAAFSTHETRGWIVQKLLLSWKSHA